MGVLLLDFSIDCVEIDTYRPAIYPVVQSEDASRVRPAEPGSSLDKALQCRSQLELGSADDTKQFRSCCLLFQQLVPLASKPCDLCFLASSR